MCCFYKRANYAPIFPILFSGFVPGLILVCYFQGLLRSHYLAFLPLVSDTANVVPEAATFTAAITAVGLFFFITSTIRYLQLRAIIHDQIQFPRIIEHFFQNHGARYASPRTAGATERSALVSANPYYDPATRRKDNANPVFEDDVLKLHIRMKVLNGVSFIMGGLICLSAAATGAFRFAETFFWHNIAAIGLFVLSPAYMIIQTYFSFRFYPFVNTEQTWKRRYYLTCVAGAVNIIFVISLVIMTISAGTDLFDPIWRWDWTPDKTAYSWHIINAVAEWVFLLLLSPYIYTMVPDFQRLTFEKMKLDYKYDDAFIEFDDYKKTLYIPGTPIRWLPKNVQLSDTRAWNMDDETKLKKERDALELKRQQALHGYQTQNLQAAGPLSSEAEQSTSRPPTQKPRAASTPSGSTRGGSKGSGGRYPGSAQRLAPPRPPAPGTPTGGQPTSSGTPSTSATPTTASSATSSTPLVPVRPLQVQQLQPGFSGKPPPAYPPPVLPTQFGGISPITTQPTSQIKPAPAHRTPSFPGSAQRVSADTPTSALPGGQSSSAPARPPLPTPKALPSGGSAGGTSTTTTPTSALPGSAQGGTPTGARPPIPPKPGTLFSAGTPLPHGPGGTLPAGGTPSTSGTATPKPAGGSEADANVSIVDKNKVEFKKEDKKEDKK